MTKEEPTRAEYEQLRDLLIKFIEFKIQKYSWFSTDEINWLIEEIERDDLDMEQENRYYYKDNKYD